MYIKQEEISMYIKQEEFSHAGKKWVYFCLIKGYDKHKNIRLEAGVTE